VTDYSAKTYHLDATCKPRSAQSSIALRRLSTIPSSTVTMIAAMVNSKLDRTMMDGSSENTVHYIIHTRPIMHLIWLLLGIIFAFAITSRFYVIVKSQKRSVPRRRGRTETCNLAVFLGSGELM